MAAKRDVFPSGDNAYLAWLTQAAAYAVAHRVALHLTQAQADALGEARGNFETDLTLHVAAQASAKAATQAKDQTKADGELVVRAICKEILNDPTIPDALKEGFGLRPHDTTRTPVPAPTTEPALLITPKGNRRHTVRAFDPADPHRRAKPAPVSQWQIFSHIGATAPAGIADCTLVATMSRSSADVAYGAEDVGKIAWYIGRGVNSKGEPGPASAAVPATIAA
jgi:hypothetical protein